MLILLEVISLLNIRSDSGSTQSKSTRTTLLDNPVDLKWAICRIVKNDKNLDAVTRNGVVNLELLWGRYKHWVKSDVPVEQTRIKQIAIFVIAGVFFFTTQWYKLSSNHIGLLTSHMMRCKKPLVQLVLAYLM